MNKRQYSSLIKQAKSCQGRRRMRYCTEDEIDVMRDLDRKTSLRGKRIRVYSSDGFVPNSYKWPAWIDYVERYYDADGKKQFVVSQTGASRSNGRGPRIVVGGRAYN